MTRRQKAIAFFVTLCVLLVASTVLLNIYWIVITENQLVELIAGLILFALIITGLIVYTVFLVMEIRRNEEHDSFINAVTHDLKWWKLPTPNASPRRSRMDAQDRLWFPEYTGDKLGVFDTRTEKFQEWPAPRKYTTPYAISAPDRNGYVYATTNTAERLMRLDPKSGEIVEYQIPTDFDSKKIAHDPTTGRTVLWMANTRAARIVKVEPLDN